jgi:gentisate 1,2-dioxygenase
MTGQGYSLVDDKRESWRQGDIINVPAGAWHQHFNTSKEQISQHLLISPDPFRQKMHLTQGAVEESYQNVPELSDAGYQPTGDWWT